MTAPGEPIGMVLIERGNLLALYDIAVNSMDFGSGFLGDEEVEQLRAVAVLLGHDPLDATPFNDMSRYPHAFDAAKGAHNIPTDYCRRCSKKVDHPAHAKSAGLDLSERDEDRWARPPTTARATSAPTTA